jgi:bacterioferritin
VPFQHKNDHASELAAIKSYNDGIQLAAQLGDNGTRDLLQDILIEEEKHIDFLEAQLDQIHQVGNQNYLTEQLA